MATDVAFWVFGAAAVWFGWRVFRTDSMVRASFALLASFLNVGAIMVLLLAEYLGVAIWFMMGVEMVVMALFMVAFMMNPAGLNPMQMVHQHRTSIAVGVVAFLALGGLAVATDLPSAPFREPRDALHDLGRALMGESMLLMESIGVTILAAMIGAVVLSSRRGRFGDALEGSEPPPLDPDGTAEGEQQP